MNTKRAPRREGVSLEQAWELHRTCLIIDGHNDVPVQRMAEPRNEIPLRWMDVDTAYDSDIPRMRAHGQQYAALMIMSEGTGSHEYCIRNIAEVDRSIRENPDAIVKVLTSADAVAAGTANKVGVIYAIEGGWGPLAGDLGNVEMLYGLGIRSAGITHKEGGPEPGYLQGSRSSGKYMTPSERAEYHRDSLGLTGFGLEVLKELNRLGIMVDLSHSNDPTIFDVLEKSASTPIVSHTVASAVCPTARGLTDDQIRAVAARRGVMGMTFYPGFIAEKKEDVTMDRFMDHVCHVADLAGVDCVGIGSDYDGGGPDIFTGDVSGMVLVTQGLLNRGFTDEDIRKIWGGNFLRIMKEVVDRAAESAGR